MKSSRYATSMPVVRVDAADDNGSGRPQTCEVPGCNALYMGEDAAGKPHHACGKADVYVNDRYGARRGICAAHYVEFLVAAGKARHQDLLDPHGATNPIRVRENWQSIEAAERDKAERDRVAAKKMRDKLAVSP